MLMSLVYIQIHPLHPKSLTVYPSIPRWLIRRIPEPSTLAFPVIPSGESNIAMENPPFVHDFPIGKGEFSIAMLDYRSVPTTRMSMDVSN